MKRVLTLDNRSGVDRTIESLREELINSGMQVGFTHEKTLELSQKLDSFIARYQASKNET
jgi:Spo0E like sporulation regulatory protein